MTASGGGPSYSWKAANLPVGIALGVSAEASNTLTGTPQTAGVYEPALTVTDTLYQGQLNLTVNDRPSVTTTTLADACLGEVFSTKLAPNDPSQFEWTPEDLPKEVGLTLELDGTLHGVIRKTGTFELKLSVRNKTTGCSSAAKTLQLKVYGEDAPSCPTIRVKGQTRPVAPVPASCVGWPFSAQFEVLGGGSPLSWSVVESAEGYLFDSTTQTLTNGEPKQDASVTLQVFDGARKVQRQFPIPLRKKCWLGYVDVTGPESGAPYRLNLVDPLLGSRVVGPITNPSDSVEDFKFSPDGKFVAYRAKDANGQYSLWLWQGPKWNATQKLNFDGSVTSYEWSSNSQVLAVAFKKPGANGAADSTKLGGVNVASVPVDTTQPLIQGLVALETRDDLVAAVDSEMAWYGNDVDGWRVAFHSPSAPGSEARSLYYAKLDKEAFLKPSPANRVYYDRTLLLFSAAAGFYAIQTSDASLTYFPIKANRGTSHGNVAISPSANFVARTDGNNLNLFSPEVSTLDGGLVSSKSIPGCKALLTWATAVERIACIDTQQATVRIYSPDANGEFKSTLVEGSEAYASSAWGSFRRLFSPTGKWLALTTTNYLYLGAWADDTLKILWPSELYSSYNAIQLSFSPDERLLALVGDERLNVFEPEGLGRVPTSAGTLLKPAWAPPSACEEDKLAPPDWCGSSRNSSLLSWSPNSDLLAFVTESGLLRVHDLRIRPIAFTSGGMDVTSVCGEPCQRQFKFQP